MNHEGGRGEGSFGGKQFVNFGLDDGQPRSLDQIGKLVNLSRERVRQIERDIMIKLRHGERAEKLRSYAS